MQLYQLLFPNGKKYIGITSLTVYQRFKEHCKPSNNKFICHKAIKKYGKENIVITVLAECDNWELLCLAEQEAIEKFNTFYPNGYNSSLGGDGVLKYGLSGDESIARVKQKKAEVGKLYYAKNKNAILAKNKDYIKKWVVEYHKKNKELLNEKSKKYHAENKKKISLRKMEKAIKKRISEKSELIIFGQLDIFEY
jgi:group I intron endonuclease